MAPLGLSLLIVFLVGILLVLGGNFSSIPLNLIFFQWEKVPVWLLVVISLLVGILLHYLLALPGRLGQWWKLRQKQDLEKILKEKEEKIHQLQEELKRFKERE